MATSKPAFPSCTVAEAIDMYVKSFAAKAFVSTADAARTIRYLFPDCEHRDDELAELVALTAIRYGRNVAFDVSERTPAAQILPFPRRARSGER